MNMKFPKDEIIIIESIRTTILNNDYNEVLKNYDKVIDNAFIINKYSEGLITKFIQLIFEMRLFEKVVNLVEQLKKQNLENFMWYYYALSSLIAKNDFYYAKSMIGRSKIINDPSIKYLIDVDEANYNGIINLHSSLLMSVGPCLIIINFINELIGESMNKKIDDEYIIMRFFDLLNLLYEYGLEDEIIEIFINTIETIYEIQVD